MHYINLVGWIAFSEVIMGSLVGSLKVVVISMLGWFVTGAVPAMGQSKDSIEVVVITLDSELTVELMTKVPSVRIVVLQHRPGESYEPIVSLLSSMPENAK